MEAVALEEWKNRFVPLQNTFTSCSRVNDVLEHNAWPCRSAELCFFFFFHFFWESPTLSQSVARGLHSWSRSRSGVAGRATGGSAVCPHPKGEQRDPAAHGRQRCPLWGQGRLAAGNEKKLVMCWGWPVLTSLASGGMLDNCRFIFPLLEALCWLLASWLVSWLLFISYFAFIKIQHFM